MYRIQRAGPRSPRLYAGWPERLQARRPLPHRSMRTADSTRAPRKRWPMRTKRSGASVTKKLVDPGPAGRACPSPASGPSTSRAVSSAESTSVTDGSHHLRDERLQSSG